MSVRNANCNVELDSHLVVVLAGGLSVQIVYLEERDCCMLVWRTQSDHLAIDLSSRILRSIQQSVVSQYRIERELSTLAYD